MGARLARLEGDPLWDLGLREILTTYLPEWFNSFMFSLGSPQ